MSVQTRSQTRTLRGSVTTPTQSSGVPAPSGSNPGTVEQGTRRPQSTGERTGSLATQKKGSSPGFRFSLPGIDNFPDPDDGLGNDARPLARAASRRVWSAAEIDAARTLVAMKRQDLDIAQAGLSLGPRFQGFPVSSLRSTLPPSPSPALSENLVATPHATNHEEYGEAEMEAAWTLIVMSQGQPGFPSPASASDSAPASPEDPVPTRSGPLRLHTPVPTRGALFRPPAPMPAPLRVPARGRTQDSTGEAKGTGAAEGPAARGRSNNNRRAPVARPAATARRAASPTPSTGSTSSSYDDPLRFYTPPPAPGRSPPPERVMGQRIVLSDASIAILGLERGPDERPAVIISVARPLPDPYWGKIKLVKGAEISVIEEYPGTSEYLTFLAFLCFVSCLVLICNCC